MKDDSLTGEGERKEAAQIREKKLSEGNMKLHMSMLFYVEIKLNIYFGYKIGKLVIFPTGILLVYQQ